MHIKLSFAFFLVTSCVCGQSYQRIHQKAIVVDTHNDILMKAADQGIEFDRDLRGKASTDLKRWKEGEAYCAPAGTTPA